jgi:hypothetical protein
MTQFAAHGAFLYYFPGHVFPDTSKSDLSWEQLSLMLLDGMVLQSSMDVAFSAGNSTLTTMCDAFSLLYSCLRLMASQVPANGQCFT